MYVGHGLCEGFTCLWLLSRIRLGGLVPKSCLTLVTLWTVAHQASLSRWILQARILEWVAISFSMKNESESHSVISDSLQTHGLYSPWNSLGQNTGVGIIQYNMTIPFPSPGDLPNPGRELRSPTLQADSLPSEPQGKPKNNGMGTYPFSRGSS